MNDPNKPRADNDLAVIVRAQGRQIEQLQARLQQLAEIIDEQIRVYGTAKTKVVQQTTAS